MRRLALVIMTLLILVPGCGKKSTGHANNQGRTSKKTVWPPNDEAIAHMNRGLTKLEKFLYLPAEREFQKALAISPKWMDAKINLMIALLNKHGKEAAKSHEKGNYDSVLSVAREILTQDPKNRHANFVTGVLLTINGLSKKALPYFDRVLERDPDDTGTLTWKGKALTDAQRYAEANQAFERALKADPYNAVAAYLRRTPLIYLGKMKEFHRMLALFRKLRPPEGSKTYPVVGDWLSGKSYFEIGKYALAIRHYSHAPDHHTPSPVTFSRPDPGDLAHYAYGGDPGPEFTPVKGKKGESDRDYVLRVVSRIGPGVVVGDYDGDGDADVYLPQWNGPGHLYRNDGKGKFTDVTAAAGITTKVHGISGTFFDADGDGDLDLYVTCAGPNVYYENDGHGRFVDRTKTSGLAGDPDVVSVSAAPGDFDQEGDVDLFVSNYCRLDDPKLTGAPDALFQNNRNGTFTDVAGKQGVSGGDLRSIGTLVLDIDHDQDPDLLVIRDRQPATLWLNERIWKFRKGKLPADLTGNLPAWGAAAGDTNRNGHEEILVLRGPDARSSFYETDDKGHLHADPGALSHLHWRSATFLDADLDGYVDLMGDDVAVLNAKGDPIAPIERGPGALPKDARGIGFADVNGDGSVDRIWADDKGAGIVTTTAPSTNHWIAFRPIGRERPQPAQWAAEVCPGQEMEIRAGRLWQPQRARVVSGFLSSIEGPVRFGLGSHTKADIVRIIWPDRVLQVEAEQPADQVLRLVEFNRKPVSCPLLFAWNGKDFRFVTDFLGGGGLGFFMAPGVYGDCDPTEYVRVGKWAKPKNGSYVMNVMEPFEEITYLDCANLVAVDHPAGWDAYPNERFTGVKACFPKDRIYAIKKRILPIRATDLKGEDVLPKISKVDRIYAPEKPDPRFLGIAAEHGVTLDFTGRVPDVPRGGRLVLFIDGTLEYGYSHSAFAVSQAGLEYKNVELDLPDGKGGWRVAVPNVGCPAGLPKTMTLDVTGIVTKEHPVFRLKTNLEVYWDRIFLGVDRARKVRITRIDAAGADFHPRGFPRDYSPDGRMPLEFDYGLMDTCPPMKNMVGDYTRFGDVTPLITKLDDRYVIMRHGEEITLRFPVKNLPPVPKGWERTLILFTGGWCKDMDPYTAYPDTVGPLPFLGMSGYPYPKSEHYPDDAVHRDYRKKWNTRRIR